MKTSVLGVQQHHGTDYLPHAVPDLKTKLISVQPIGPA